MCDARCRIRQDDENTSGDCTTVLAFPISTLQSKFLACAFVLLVAWHARLPGLVFRVERSSRLRGKDRMAQDVRLNLEEQTGDAVFRRLPSRRVDDGVVAGTGAAAARWFDRSINVCCIGGRERARAHVGRIANVELERRGECRRRCRHAPSGLRWRGRGRGVVGIHQCRERREVDARGVPNVELQRRGCPRVLALFPPLLRQAADVDRVRVQGLFVVAVAIR
jgi:hypothetical protein